MFLHGWKALDATFPAMQNIGMAPVTFCASSMRSQYGTPILFCSSPRPRPSVSRRPAVT